MSDLFSRRSAGFLILGLWIVSLVLPAFSSCNAGYRDTGGWFLLLFGWFGVLEMMPAWFANIFIVLIALLLIFHRRAPIWLGIPAAVLAATAWWWTAWQDDSGPVPICHYQAGYWLWLAVGALALVVTFLPLSGARNAPL
ncbi:MAG TPA: hypothetical protein VIJ85_08230 [Rhizomicrobium sp.]